MANRVSEQRRARAAQPLLWLALSLALGAGLSSASCLERRSAERSDTLEGCAACHGDSRRAGSALLRAAPPRDLLGAQDPSYPGVGAHEIHLRASATHGAMACDECHVVPERTDSPGHADDGAPAEVVFGRVAQSGGLAPSYDPIARRCADSHCHAAARAVWTEPRDSQTACGSCHGLPPPAPHPSSTLCSTCHGDVIDDKLSFKAPELHVNGVVELVAETCTQCHGSGDDPAPPADTRGFSARRAIGVGAHAAHLSGGSASRPLACSECHRVPQSADDFSHADGLPAEVELTGVAQTAEREPTWDRPSASCVDGWCHAPGAERGAASPAWTSSAALGCADCHGLPPPSPHPQISDCSACHGEVVAADDTSIVGRERHVDGVVDVSFEQECTSCHGSDNPAPPRALNGDTMTTAAGVGAHQTHLAGSARARAVTCQECHLLPERVLDPGHVDSFGPAEVTFSGVSVAFGAMPSYVAGGCSNTACHGGSFPVRGHDSGGTLTAPLWTVVDGSQAACGTCHGLPPPRPHPYHAEDCGRCHENLSLDGKTFLRPELHVDGIVTFAL
jgi:predicted CxxxxCH...CXXCH cytochrome family protein